MLSYYFGVVAPIIQTQIKIPKDNSIAQPKKCIVQLKKCIYLIKGTRIFGFLDKKKTKWILLSIIYYLTLQTRLKGVSSWCNG